MDASSISSSSGAFVRGFVFPELPRACTGGGVFGRLSLGGEGEGERGRFFSLVVRAGGGGCVVGGCGRRVGFQPAFGAGLMLAAVAALSTALSFLGGIMGGMPGGRVDGTSAGAWRASTASFALASSGAFSDRVRDELLEDPSSSSDSSSLQRGLEGDFS